MADDVHRPDEVIPLAEERLTLGIRQVETDRVRVRTIVEERPGTITATLERGVVDVERVPVFREVLQPPPPRQEGNTIIVSVVEERLVKRTFVIEEVHLRTRSVPEQAELHADLRVMRAEIERPDVYLSKNRSEDD